MKSAGQALRTEGVPEADEETTTAGHNRKSASRFTPLTMSHSEHTASISAITPAPHRHTPGTGYQQGKSHPSSLKRAGRIPGPIHPDTGFIISSAPSPLVGVERVHPGRAALPFGAGILVCYAGLEYSGEGTNCQQRKTLTGANTV